MYSEGEGPELRIWAQEKEPAATSEGAGAPASDAMPKTRLAARTEQE